jgi:FtsZ-binding cell division protein ZapB
MDGGDYFNLLSGKVNELKHKKNDIIQDVARERAKMTQLEAEILQLEQELQKVKNDVASKDA